MNNPFDFIRKTMARIHELGRQFHIDAFEFESHELVFGKGIWPKTDYDKAPPQYTVIAIACSQSMNAADYCPTRFTCGIHAAMEYVKVRARQDPKDRVALVCFSNETRFVVHPITMQDGFTIQQYGDEVTLRGSTHIGKGLRGVMRVFKRQGKSNHQRHVILLTDNWGGDATQKVKTLGLKYDAVIHIVVIGQAEVKEDKATLLKMAANEPDGNIHCQHVKDAEGLIEHFRLLAAGGDNNEDKSGQIGIRR